jgi:hypothetical protein
MSGIVPLTTNRVELVDMPAINAEDEAHAMQLQRELVRPYPVPVVDWKKGA